MCLEIFFDTGKLDCLFFEHAGNWHARPTRHNICNIFCVHIFFEDAAVGLEFFESLGCCFDFNFESWDSAVTNLCGFGQITSRFCTICLETCLLEVFLCFFDDSESFFFVLPFGFEFARSILHISYFCLNSFHALLCLLITCF